MDRDDRADPGGPDPVRGDGHRHRTPPDRSESLGPALGGITSLFAFLGGSWCPITGSGSCVDLAHALPSYWLVQAGHIGIGAAAWRAEGWLVVGIWTVAMVAAGRMARTAATRDGSDLRTMRRRSFDSRNGLAELFGGEPGATSAGWKPLLFPGIWPIYLLQTAGGVNTYSDGVVAAVGYAAIVAFGASYLLAIHAARTNPVHVPALFAAMFVLTFIEIPIAHEDAFGDVRVHRGAGDGRVRVPRARPRRDPRHRRHDRDRHVPPGRLRVGRRSRTGTCSSRCRWCRWRCSASSDPDRPTGS